MAIATLRDVWPRVSQLQHAPQMVLDEVRRLYQLLHLAPADQRPAIEAEIRALADDYKRTTGDA
jgi:hypothetical protein